MIFLRLGQQFSLLEKRKVQHSGLYELFGRLVIQRNYQTNHVIPTIKLAGHCSNTILTPPPPSSPTTAVAASTSAAAAAIITHSSLTKPNFRHLQSHTQSSHNSTQIYKTTSSIQSFKIASQRTAQLARHFSSSTSSENTYYKTDSKSEMASQYGVRKVAAPNTLEHRVYIEKDGVPVSAFHDIPLYANPEQTVLNMIVEIPRWTNAKLEISKDELLNPIKQDIKKGKLRYVRNCFPHKGYLWNYGAFPQTWEDPNSIHPETKAKGDNDPLDVCEIGELVGYPGQVKQVKVLGVMALLDEEETDWKVIVVDVNDPLAPKLNDVEDVERHLPGLLRATNEWFRIYKIPDGKPENQFAFTGECKNKSYAFDVIRECSEAWERLITGKTQPGGISTTNLSVNHSPSRVGSEQLPPLPPNEEVPAEKIDSSIDKWFFISGAAA
ncbi:inorganic pyrophosphatase [Annulohypoxylon maeteangense]|uniref:inorganic pyrophosphatase n=1 Tax=Annulohypoxylon maeteangense TaxID=1927788 RepID=UPI002007381B|nr:inorganic pyrophosphatase [Annulohypoxylon maeteangense]KAI0880385.1 inorganic pyrophosphatase [Annulohypoxylon maeteangense]